MSGGAPAQGRDRPWVTSALAPRAIDCFAWQDEGATLTTTTGATVAFRGEVRAILHALAPGGLPAFSAIYALLASTCAWWNEARAMMLARASPGVANDDDLRRRLDLTVELLDRVHDFPAELRASLGARVHLALAACEPMVGRGSPTQARELVLAFERGLTGHLTPRQPEDAAQALAREIISLRPGLERMDASSLRRRLATGLDEELLPATTIDWQPPALAARRLISELLADPELGPLARLAQRVEAALPPPATDLSSARMATAGVAGLTNRGPLERLVTSELAWDDETLAARIALGEALYLSREPERTRTPGARVILLDAGLRMWGVRRLFATAVAMAMAARASAEVHDTVLVWRAEGERIVPVDLGSRSGVEAQLGALSPAPHPGAALPRLSELLDELNSQGAHVEPVLVTCQECLADPELREALAAQDASNWHVVTADSSGHVRLAPVSKGRALQPLVEATLELKEILACPPQQISPPPSLRGAGGRGLPAVLYRRDFPFRLPHRPRVGDFMLPSAAGAVSVTRDGRLLLSDGPGRCAIQLLDSVPPDTSWVLPAPEDELLIVQSSAAATRVVRLHLFSRESRITLLPTDLAGPPRGAALTGEALALLAGHELLAFDPDSGQRLHIHPLPPATRYLGAGVFWIDRACRRLTFERGRFEEHVLPARGFEFHDSPLAVFQRSHGRGLWAVSREEPILVPLTTDDQVMRTAQPSRRHALRGISHDGNRVVLSVMALEDGQRSDMLLDLEAGASTTCEPSQRGSGLSTRPGRGHSTFAAAELELRFEPGVLAQVDTTHGVRTKFSSVFIDAEGNLGLVSRRGVPLLVRVVPTGETMSLALVRRDIDLGRVRSLAHFDQALKAPAGAGYRLRGASFPCGSRAILDSRGLLHLVSAVPGLPEISLVLGDRWLAGWSSEGRVTGPRHFLESGGEQVEPALFFVGLRHFAAAVE